MYSNWLISEDPADNPPVLHSAAAPALASSSTATTGESRGPNKRRHNGADPQMPSPSPRAQIAPSSSLAVLSSLSEGKDAKQDRAAPTSGAKKHKTDHYKNKSKRELKAKNSHSSLDFNWREHRCPIEKGPSIPIILIDDVTQKSEKHLLQLYRRKDKKNIDFYITKPDLEKLSSPHQIYVPHSLKYANPNWIKFNYSCNSKTQRGYAIRLSKSSLDHLSEKDVVKSKRSPAKLKFMSILEQIKTFYSNLASLNHAAGVLGEVRVVHAVVPSMSHSSSSSMSPHPVRAEEVVGPDSPAQTAMATPATQQLIAPSVSSSSSSSHCVDSDVAPYIRDTTAVDAEDHTATVQFVRTSTARSSSLILHPILDETRPDTSGTTTVDADEDTDTAPLVNTSTASSSSSILHPIDDETRPDTSDTTAVDADDDTDTAPLVNTSTASYSSSSSHPVESGIPPNISDLPDADTAPLAALEMSSVLVIARLRYELITSTSAMSPSDPALSQRVSALNDLTRRFQELIRQDEIRGGVPRLSTVFAAAPDAEPQPDVSHHTYGLRSF